MLKTRSTILILDNVRSIFNVGSLIRTAEALGVNEIVYLGYTPYPEIDNDQRIKHLRIKIDQQIKKTSLGAEKNIKHLLISNAEDYIKKIQKKGYKVLALEQSKNSIDLNLYIQVDENVALIVGNEVTGVSEDLLNISDNILEIPLKGKKESLNVVQAAAIAINQICK